MQLSTISLLIILIIFFTVNCQYTQLDTKFGPLVKIARLFMSDLIKPRSFEAGYQANAKKSVSANGSFEDQEKLKNPLKRKFKFKGWEKKFKESKKFQIFLKFQKTQQIFTDEFFCDTNGSGQRSTSVPTSVHKLTPGDIDVIGALGDSLTAANGALAVNSLQTLLENRGISWSIGGRDNWRKFITLPNLIKVYNPNLYGYSEAMHAVGFQRESKFNVAEPGESVCVCV